jgi:hypothetical protein
MRVTFSLAFLAWSAVRDGFPGEESVGKIQTAGTVRYDGRQTPSWISGRLAGLKSRPAPCDLWLPIVDHSRFFEIGR